MEHEHLQLEYPGMLLTARFASFATFYDSVTDTLRIKQLDEVSDNVCRNEQANGICLIYMITESCSTIDLFGCH
jgi:hypothetical protein